ncbi:MAG TPA: hypothetical protein VKB79_26380 [Bryobacteraceae bacterium]|nr:hypothetical protein [Bryobacteraceae bacterium]
MIEMVYRDLAEFGLLFITPEAPAYAVRVREIQIAPWPFGPAIDTPPERAAVLENHTQSAIVTLTYVWRYTTATGETRTSHHSNLGSSRQMDVLTGREKAVRDLATFILPGARRLITERGMFGDNRSVLAVEATGGGGRGWVGSGAGRGVESNDFVKIALELDVAILEDGLCVGPDGVGLRESLTEQMQTQSDMAKEITKALRGGAGRGRIFEMLLPLARHTRPAPPLAPGVSNVPSMVGRSHGGHPHLLSMFASSSVQQLINADDARLLAWFDEAAAISPLRLHPPEQ